MNVPYNKLEAFPVSAKRGWGVRCGVPILQGQVVVEVRGRCLTEDEYEELADPSYVVSFDDKLLALKRAAGDDVMYIDLKEYGNMVRSAAGFPTPSPLAGCFLYSDDMLCSYLVVRRCV